MKTKRTQGAMIEPKRPRDICRACWYGAEAEDCPACRRLATIALRGFDHADDGAMPLPTTTNTEA